MRPSWALWLSLVLLLPACGNSVTTADVLDVTVSAEIVRDLRPDPPQACQGAGCVFHYRIRVRNPSDQRIWVPACHLRATDRNGLEIVSTDVTIGAPAGVFLEPGRAAVGSGSELFAITRHDTRRIRDLVVGPCAAWDWHDDPPV